MVQELSEQQWQIFRRGAENRNDQGSVRLAFHQHREQAMTDWYYYDNDGQRQGPYSGGQIKRLAKNGKIAPETVVETEGGKSVPAEKVKGLTFLGTNPTAKTDNGIASMAEDLGEQDFEQLREDFERLQKQQERQQKATQNIAAPTSPSPPPQLVSAPQSAAPNPFRVSTTTVNPTEPTSIHPIAKGLCCAPQAERLTCAIYRLCL